MSYVVIAVHDHPQRETFTQQLAFFTDRIVPAVASMPGYQSGRWAYDTTASRSHGYVAFDTEAHARALLETLHHDRDIPNPFGVTLISATLAHETVTR